MIRATERVRLHGGHQFFAHLISPSKSVGQFSKFKVAAAKLAQVERRLVFYDPTNVVR